MISFVTEDYSKDIEYLDKLFTNFQTNLYFTITTILGILTIALAISGWALTILVRKWVNENVEKELSLIDERITTSINQNKQVVYRTGHIHEAGMTLSAHGINGVDAVWTGENTFDLSNIPRFSNRQFLNLVVVDEDGSYLEKKIIFKKDGTISVELFNSKCNGGTYWILTYLKQQ